MSPGGELFEQNAVDVGGEADSVEGPGIQDLDAFLDHRHGSAAACNGGNRLRGNTVGQQDTDYSSSLGLRRGGNFRHLFDCAIDIRSIICFNSI